MAIQQHAIRLPFPLSPAKEINITFPLSFSASNLLSEEKRAKALNFPLLPDFSSKLPNLPSRAGALRRSRYRHSCSKHDDPELMDTEERKEWRQKIRKVLDTNPDTEEDEEVDNSERQKMMQKLLADYPLVVEEDDPHWPEDADGWGFNLGSFFDKITIKNNKKDSNDDDDKDDSDDEIVWQDDNYIRPIKDVTIAEWEETVFKDISPLIVLVHNRYKRPKENEKTRDELEKAVQIIWNCGLPSPRCVAVDAIVEPDLVSALKVSVFPELIFTKAGKILYREKGTRGADELSKLMAYFYYGAAKPACWNSTGEYKESIPSVLSNN